MGRRKRATIEDDMDSSGDSTQGDYDGEEELNGDERAERALFENPYQQRKRRRLNRKDDATYGIFGEEEEDRPRYARAKRAKYIHASWVGISIDFSRFVGRRRLFLKEPKSVLLYPKKTRREVLQTRTVSPFKRTHRLIQVMTRATFPFLVAGERGKALRRKRKRRWRRNCQLQD
jgi:hypothetical protein